MPPDEDGSGEGDVLAPEELDISNDDNVTEIDDGRFVISPDDGGPDVDAGGESVEIDSHPEPDPVEGDVTEKQVRDWLEDHVGGSRSEYGFTITAKFDDRVSRQELFSNDVVITFENLLMWYTQHVGEDVPVEEALGLLLMESNLSARYPASAVRALVSEHGLGPEDTIADLVRALDEDVRFPP